MMNYLMNMGEYYLSEINVFQENDVDFLKLEMNKM